MRPSLCSDFRLVSYRPLAPSVSRTDGSTFRLGRAILRRPRKSDRLLDIRSPSVLGGPLYSALSRFGRLAGMTEWAILKTSALCPGRKDCAHPPPGVWRSIRQCPAVSSHGLQPGPRARGPLAIGSGRRFRSCRARAAEAHRAKGARHADERMGGAPAGVQSSAAAATGNRRSRRPRHQEHFDEANGPVRSIPPHQIVEVVRIDSRRMGGGGATRRSGPPLAAAIEPAFPPGPSAAPACRCNRPCRRQDIRRARTPCIAVMAMIRKVPRGRRSARIARTASIPSISGICTSISTTSRIAPTARRRPPVPHIDGWPAVQIVAPPLDYLVSSARAPKNPQRHGAGPVWMAQAAAWRSAGANRRAGQFADLAPANGFSSHASTAAASSPPPNPARRAQI